MFHYRAESHKSTLYVGNVFIKTVRVKQLIVQ